MRLLRCLWTALLVLLLAPTAEAQSQPLVVRLTLHGTVQPVSASYLHRGLAEAAALHAQLVLLSLDTPGGLLDSTRAIVDDIERSPVPVAVFISPTGARAGSAGFFLLESADIAAMSPGTNAGASHPILAGAGQESRPMDPVLRDKLANDASAFLRSFTSRRNRNVQAAESAVRDSKSFSDTEALNLHLIDVVAPNDRTLLSAIPGLTLRRFDGTPLHLDTTSATILTIPPSPRERFLTLLTNPDLAVLLLFAGVLLIYLEFNVPGTVIPGALGTFMVLLGLFGLNLLPIRHTSAALVLAGFALMLLEFKIASHGILAFTGILSLVTGLATLVDAPIQELQVHTATALSAGVAFGAITLWLAWIALRARRNKVLLGPEAMIGKLAIACTDLHPAGQVEVRGEIWQAVLRDPAASVASGQSVLIREAHGLQLLVEACKNTPAE